MVWGLGGGALTPSPQPESLRYDAKGFLSKIESYSDPEHNTDPTETQGKGYNITRVTPCAEMRIQRGCFR